MDILVPHESRDSRGNSNNLATAVFLFPSFLKATPYAFKDSIKVLSHSGPPILHILYNIINRTESQP